MGKTFRRGGSEQGYYSPGKSIRDKRQNSNKFRNLNENNQSKTNMGKRKKLDRFTDNNEW